MIDPSPHARSAAIAGRRLTTESVDRPAISALTECRYKLDHFQAPRRYRKTSKIPLPFRSRQRQPLPFEDPDGPPPAPASPSPPDSASTPRNAIRTGPAPELNTAGLMLPHPDPSPVSSPRVSRFTVSSIPSPRNEPHGCAGDFRSVSMRAGNASVQRTDNPLRIRFTKWVLSTSEFAIQSTMATAATTCRSIGPPVGKCRKGHRDQEYVERPQEQHMMGSFTRAVCECH